MKTRALLVGTITLAVTVVFAGCGSSTRSARDVRVGDPSSTTSPSTAAGPSSLAEFETGVGAVAENEPQPIWFETDAVAALDGTSVFAIHHDTATDTDLLVRIDPATGAVMKQWPLPQTGLSISAVAPKARWIALTDRHPGYGSQDRATTHLVVFDAFTGVIVKQLDLTGDVQPEAFSVDGSLVFALDYRIGYYRVQTIEVATGIGSTRSVVTRRPPKTCTVTRSTA